MNRLIHGLIAVFFGVACWFLWGVLTLTSNVMLRISDHPPAFTQLCVSLRPVLVVLPALAAGYCLLVWIRKAEVVNSWFGFLASTMMALVLVLIPTMIAIWLPVIQFIEKSLAQ